MKNVKSVLFKFQLISGPLIALVVVVAPAAGVRAQDIAQPKKLYSVLVQAKKSGTESAAFEPSPSGTDRESRLLEVYEDYRFERIRAELGNLDPSELSPAEVFLLAMAYHVDGELSAIESLRPFFENDPSVYGRLAAIASIHLSHGIGEAIKLADELHRNESTPETWAFRCMLRTFGDGDTASDYAVVAKSYLDAWPNDLKAHIEYSNALKTKDHRQAIDFLNGAIHKFPQSIMLRNYLGHSLANLNRHNEAINVYDEAISLAPDVENLYYMRGVIAWELGRADQFEEDCLKASALSPSPMYLVERILVLLRRNEVDAAIETARSLSLAHPQPLSHALLAIALASGDREAEKQQAIELIVEAGGREYVQTFCRAIADLRANRMESAADGLLVCRQFYRLAPLCSKWLARCGESIGFVRVKNAIRLPSGDELASGTIFRIEQQHQHRMLGVVLVNSKPERVWLDPSSVEPVVFK